MCKTSGLAENVYLSHLTKREFVSYFGIAAESRMEEMNCERLDSTVSLDGARTDGPPFLVTRHLE